MSVCDYADDDNKDGNQDHHQQHCHSRNGSRQEIVVLDNRDITGVKTA